MKISILVDTPDSWIIPFAQNIQKQLSAQHDSQLYAKSDDVPFGDILFLLGCTSIVSSKVLKKNKHNIVIHESALPKGRGHAPVAWQILENKRRIPIVAFEASISADAGVIYLKDAIELDGTELLPEIKQKQGKKTAEMVYTFIEQCSEIVGSPQVGKATYYSKRTRTNDEIDTTKSIIDNFNHLRVVDNEKYPAWFSHLGQKYILKVYKA
jgi:methionyl-tRNA formyltransferase